MSELGEPFFADEGRPSLYTLEIAREILTRIASGETLAHICDSPEAKERPEMPRAQTVRWWVICDKWPGFAEAYKQARLLQMEAWADETVDIADDGRNDFMVRKIGKNEHVLADREHIARSDLRVKTRQWLMQKVAPSVFGEASKLELTGKDGAALQPAINVTIAKADVG